MTGQHDSISLDLSPASDISSTLAHGTCISSDSRMPHAHEESYRSGGAANLNNLPEDIFRGIFAFCLSDLYWNPIGHMKEWQRLVQVCQRWRQIIYGSPSFFDLHLHCSAQTPFRDNHSRWPEFPLTVHYVIPDHDQGDLIDALKCIDRVRRIELVITDTEIPDVFAAMQFSFPALIHLDITGHADSEGYLEDVILPWDLMKGFAPSLQHLRFSAISYPSLPAFLSSARGLVSLQLEDIPPDGVGYISPGNLVGRLAGLSSLTTLCITFSPWFKLPSIGERDSPDASTHVVLPALTHFVFRGGCDYLEILIAHISTPRVEDVQIEYLTRVVDRVEAPQLCRFVDRTGYLGFAQFSRAQLSFFLSEAYIKLDRAQGECHQAQFSFTIREADPPPLEQLDFPVPLIVHVLRQLVAMFSNVGHLTIIVHHHGKSDRLDTAKWPPLLRLFPAVEALHVSGRLAGHLATVFDDIAEERVTDVLSALRSLQLGDDDGLVGSADLFLAWRQCAGRPVTLVSSQDTFVE